MSRATSAGEVGVAGEVKVGEELAVELVGVLGLLLILSLIL